MPLEPTGAGALGSTGYAPDQDLMDATASANVKVLGDAPAIAMGNLYQATSASLADAAHNATVNQPPLPGGGASQVSATAVVIARVAP